MCEQLTTKASERNCSTQLPNLCLTYRRLLHQTAPLTLQWEWQSLSSAFQDSSQSTLGNMERRHQDWFEDYAADIRSHIHFKDLHTMLCCGIQLLALFMNDFPLFVRQCCDSAATVLRQCCDSAATVLRQCCDSAATVLRQCCDSAATVQRRLRWMENN